MILHLLDFVLLGRAFLDNVGDDCPVFDGLFEYSSISAGGSMGQSFLCLYYYEMLMPRMIRGCCPLES